MSNTTKPNSAQTDTPRTAAEFDHPVYSDFKKRLTVLVGSMFAAVRESALREAADIVSHHASMWRGGHYNTNDTCGTLRKSILAAIEKGKS